MSSAIDLNHIRNLVLDSQIQGHTHPLSPKATVAIDRDARIRTGDTLRPGEYNHVAIVQPDVFHAGWEQAERRIVETKMPANTRMYITREGVRGWIYSFQTEFRDTYKMFAFFDSGFYQVQVIEPNLEQRFRSPHIGHIFSNGRICMGASMDAGRRTLADAYAKSVLWANGISAMIHGNLDKFPFNYND